MEDSIQAKKILCLTVGALFMENVNGAVFNLLQNGVRYTTPDFPFHEPLFRWLKITSRIIKASFCEYEDALNSVNDVIESFYPSRVHLSEDEVIDIFTKAWDVLDRVE